MTHTKKVDKYRAILFIALAVMFPLGFILRLYELRGHFMILTFEDMLKNNTEFCLLGTTQNILPLVLKNEVFFPIEPVQVVGSIIGIFAVGLTVGSGFCSWACFWGGWEEGFSRIRKKAVIKKINPKLRWTPFAVLVSTAFLSAFFFTSFYCFWLCPFKAVSEFVELSTSLVIIQTVIFLALFIGLVIILPILTKKRTQCSFLCPFGALLSFFHNLNPFEIRINKEKCNECKKCIGVCPVLAISTETLPAGKTNISCIRCAKCVDNCPQNAASYHLLQE
jgi:polyferredoxin